MTCRRSLMTHRGLWPNLAALAGLDLRALRGALAQPLRSARAAGCERAMEGVRFDRSVTRSDRTRIAPGRKNLTGACWLGGAPRAGSVGRLVTRMRARGAQCRAR